MIPLVTKSGWMGSGLVSASLLVVGLKADVGKNFHLDRAHTTHAPHVAPSGHSSRYDFGNFLRQVLGLDQ